MKRIAVLVVIALSLSFLLLLLSSTKTGAQFGVPVILSAGIDAANNKLKIGGTSFAANPRVSLGTVTLTVQSATASEIVTDFGTTTFLPGSYVLKVQFSNGTFAVFVLNVGAGIEAGGCGTNAPIVSAFNRNGLVGQTVVVTFTVSDPDEAACGPQPFAIHAILMSAPLQSTASINTTTGQSVSFVPDLAGTYVVRVTATDSTGRIGFTDVTVTVGLP